MLSGNAKKWPFFLKKEQATLGLVYQEVNSKHFHLLSKNIGSSSALQLLRVALPSVTALTYS